MYDFKERRKGKKRKEKTHLNNKHQHHHCDYNQHIRLQVINIWQYHDYIHI